MPRLGVAKPVHGRQAPEVSRFMPAEIKGTVQVGFQAQSKHFLNTRRTDV